MTARPLDIRSQHSAKPFGRTPATTRRTWTKITQAVGGSGPEWSIVLLPTALSIKTQYSAASGSTKLLVLAAYVLSIGFLVAMAYLRRSEQRFETHLGPLLLFCGAGAVALSRPSGIHNLLIFALVGALAFRVVQIVDARRIIASLVDGIGLYSLANVVAYYVLGMRSPSEATRMNLGAEHLSRVTFPLSLSVNLAPLIAATYLAAVYFLFREQDSRRRAFRILCAAASAVIVFESDSRVAALAAVVVVLTVFLFPATLRRLTSCLVVLAFLSPWLLRPIIAGIRDLIALVLSVVSTRSDLTGDKISDLAGRGYIWEKALSFWSSDVNSPFEILFGYGLQGHYKSGASHQYASFMSSIFRDTEKLLHTHNSWLQLLFDSGLIGMFLMGGALLWASLRLSRQAQEWGAYALAASTMISVLVLGSMTEVLLTPDANIHTFYVMMIVVASACQIKPIRGPQNQVVETMDSPN
jgi:O-antigen ligase